MKSRNKAPMNARDVMTKPVVSVHPDTSLREIARLLLDKGISAVPVVDDKGAPIGMVSEGDLIRPERAAREAWRQSRLEIFAEGEPLAPELLAWLQSQNHIARAAMSVAQERRRVAARHRYLELYRPIGTRCVDRAVCCARPDRNGNPFADPVTGSLARP